MSFLGLAIGRELANSDGLTAAYLPDGVPSAIAEGIVRGANDARPIAPPFGILVTAGAEDSSDERCLRMSSKTAIKYRTGDRLAVVDGRHPDLNSFVQAFREVLEPGYPLSASNGLRLEDLAGRSLDLVVEAAGLANAKYWDHALATQRLVAVLQCLAEAYRAQGQGTESWNAYWFRHIDLGLRDLALALEHVARSSSTITLDEALAVYTYAAFALPRPRAGLAYERAGGSVGKRLVEALATYWSDQQSIETTAKQLRFHPDHDPKGQPHSLERLDWSELGRLVAGFGNPLLAWATAPDRSTVVDRVVAFAGLTEGEFFHPHRAIEADPSLRLSDAAGIPFGIEGFEGPQIVPAMFEVEPHQLRSVVIRVAVPIMDVPDEGVIAASAVTLEARGAKSAWVGELSLRDGELWAEGQLTIALSGDPARVPVRAVTLSLTIPAQDPLIAYLGRSTSPPIYLAPDSACGAFYFTHRANGAMNIGQFVGSDLVKPAKDDMAAPFQEPLDAGTRVTLAAFGDSGGEVPSIGGKPMTPISDGRPLWLGHFVASGLDRLSVGDLAVEWRAPEASGEHQSPLLAAMDHGVVSSLGPEAPTLHSVRGRAESYWAENVEDDYVRAALGHIATVEGEEVGFNHLVLGPDGAMLMEPDLAASWHARTNFAVPLEIIASEEAEAFRSAMVALKLPERLLEAEGEGGASYRWPSRTSWRHLWAEGGDLEAYLRTYADLLQRARATHSPAAVFWAAYPFSVSVWSTHAGAKCRAVLLSPLHPIRLAWLAGVEQVLWNAQEPQRLAGIVEGWNFPLLGPRNNTNGRMMAVPIDTGDSQVFTGWSMVVDASVNGHEPLEAPARIGNLPAPGSSASGLNASAVEGALRTYRRMNPHVSTLTIDLAAFSPGPRLQEIDKAILKNIGAWAGTTAPAPRGGVRVRDSLYRLGDVPRAELDKLLAERPDTPILWTRYKHDPANSQESNLRLLQDAGVGIEISSGYGENGGLVGMTPIRRYEVPRAQGTVSNSSSWPALRHGVGWDAFSTALSELEMAETVPVVDAQLFQSAIVDPAAEWTVCGESLLSPGALAPMIAGGGGGRQMLWEWRPPFLDKEAGALLERRPFVSVVRIPAAFRSQIHELLEKAQSAPATEDQVDDLLGALGSRGVGLSSLMAMGGTHAAGALGFYLTFRLMDHVRVQNAEHIVIPIDACDSFLRALADGGATTDADSLRRADLLVIRVERDAIRLIPIEIKFYGFQAATPHPYLPGTTSSKLNEPLEQLGSTVAMLESIRERQRGFGSGQMEPQHELWLNALATLLEAGMRLRLPAGADADLLGEALTRTLQGDLNVELGRPLLCYFGHEATTNAGATFQNFLDVLHPGHESLGPIGGLLANTAAAFEAVEDGTSPLSRGWAEVIEWAGAPSVLPGGRHRAPGSVTPGKPGDFIAPPMSDDGSGTPAREAGDVEIRSSDLDGDDALTQGSEAEFPAVPPDEKRTDRVRERDAQTPRSVSDAIVGEGIRFPLGSPLSTLSGAPINFWPSNTRLNQLNLGVVGDLGTGKTQFLKAFTHQMRKESEAAQPEPVSMLIFDYKRDFQDSHFLGAVGGKVLKPFHIPLNVFALHAKYTPQVAYQRARAFVDILAKIYKGIGPVQRNRLTLAIKELYAEKDGGAPTIPEVLDRYRESVGTEDSVTSCLDIFVLGEIFGDDPSELSSFEEMLDDSVTVVALNELGQDQDTKNALVVLFLNMYFEYMHGLTKWPFQGSDPQLRRINSMLLVDEATNIMKYEFPVLMDLMLQGREFGVGVILASQYLSHFKAGSTNYGQPLLTWLIHKVPSVSGRELRALGLTNATDEHAKVVTELGVHEALCSTMDVPAAFIRGVPFYELDAERTQDSQNP